jgi:hypothetical protein
LEVPAKDWDFQWEASNLGYEEEVAAVDSDLGVSLESLDLDYDEEVAGED